MFWVDLSYVDLWIGKEGEQRYGSNNGTEKSICGRASSFPSSDE
jgi:hypothetical protein